MSTFQYLVLFSGLAEFVRVFGAIVRKLSTFMVAYAFLIYVFAILCLLLSRGKVSKDKAPYFEDDAYGYMLWPMYDIWSLGTGDFNWHQDNYADDPNIYFSMTTMILINPLAM